MNITDNVKALAKRHGMTRAAVREAADDLGLVVNYATDRRTWVVAEDAATVRAFDEHLAEVAR